MEAYKKKQTQNETSIIQHIKFIAKDLFQNEQSPNNHPFHQKYQRKQAQESKQFIRTTHRQGKYKEFSIYPRAQPTSYMQPTLPHSTSKGKKKPIFQNFDEFWSNCRQSPAQHETTPIMERINKNVYSRFKTEINLSQNILNPTERQERWNQFLKNSERWERERKKSIRQSQMRVITGQSPQLRKRISTVTNLNYKDIQADKQMTEVEKSIRQLRFQVQKIRGKILKIDGSEANNHKRTYHRHH